MQLRERVLFDVHTKTQQQRYHLLYSPPAVWQHKFFPRCVFFNFILLIFFYKSFHLDADFVYIYTQTLLRFDARSPSRSLIKLSLSTSRLVFQIIPNQIWSNSRNWAVNVPEYCCVCIDEWHNIVYNKKKNNNKSK